MLDQLTGMRVFARATIDGSLSAAARRLGMSAAMATKHLNALETRLGVKLLLRTTRRLSLTDAGRDYLEACQRILADIDEADAAAAAQLLRPKGVLRISAPVSFGAAYLAPLLPTFSSRYPEVRIELGLNDRMVDLIEENWDMSIRIGTLPDQRLRVRPLARAAVLICASPAYLAHHGTPRSIPELAAHNCLDYTLSLQGATGWRFGSGAAQAVPIRGNLSANNGEALMAAAIGGQGIVRLPSFIVAPALRSGQLVELELSGLGPDVVTIHAAYPPQQRPTAKVRAMIDYLVDAFADEQAWPISAAGARAQ